ncbi:class I SAM-dependent methyltransferase [Paenibacillus sp. N1-5-1-14]|uniref:tRNA (adenine(22)-N(1))-methyltransferase n=1 Tax=Paenibacillus radicibacter TaxID=2972488 RepID=UPI002158DDC7|nr:class I SAM-dependent methyltransferase [Paenibacillus radicibacter]MCR8641962.1 class I SAM-dependent methyltransferase [Paenibacillus radicibacter]
MIKLSKRLEMIAQRVPQGSRVADIGSDHALLPTYLVQQGMISFAVAGEVNEGPRDAAQNQVRMAGLAEKISVRLGNGLAVIEPGEVETITIAGMGGSLISTILEEGKHKLTGVRTLILQPNVGEDFVRRWLDENGWLLTGETILEEDGKIYEILTATRNESDENREAFESMRGQLYAQRVIGQNGEVSLDKEMLMRLGPWLVAEASPVWVNKWQSELLKMDRVRSSMGQSEQESAKLKKESLTQEMNQIQEVLTCLQKVQL